MTLRGYTDALEGALARIIADARREIEREREIAAAALAGIQARVAEAEAWLSRAEARQSAFEADVRAMVAERLAGLRDGVDGRDGEAGPPGERGEPGERGADGAPGRAVDPEDVRRMVAEAVAEISPPDLSGFATREEVAAVRDALADLPPPRDWAPEIAAARCQATELVERAVTAAETMIEHVKDRLEHATARLPVFRAWEDRVHYAGEVAHHDGTIWQAQRDTGRAPPHDDWAPIVARGEPGTAGASLRIRGTYDPDGDYRALDVAALDGSAFVAKLDDPGPCPGEGWQLLASRGGRGKPGESIKGDRGPAGSRPVALTLTDEGVLTLTFDDGQEFAADFYPLFARVAK